MTGDMKRTLILAFALLTLVSSCDFIRSIAGRPTSQQLEQIRQDKIAREEALQQARIDSLKRVQQAMEDSLAAMEKRLLDSLSQVSGTILNPSALGGLFTTRLETKYYIIVGAFRNRSYAERKLEACNAAGYTGTIISFRNGLLAVGIYPSNNLQEIVRKLQEIRGTGICPKEGWILMNT